MKIKSQLKITLCGLFSTIHNPRGPKSFWKCSKKVVEPISLNRPFKIYSAILPFKMCNKCLKLPQVCFLDWCLFFPVRSDLSVQLYEVDLF